jgi:hypothetical protein
MLILSLNRNKVMKIKQIICIVFFSTCCVFANEAGNMFIVEEFQKLPNVDISDRMAWNTKVYFSKKYEYAKARYTSLFSGNFKEDLAKLTPSEKYIIFAVAWRDGGTKILESIIESAWATDSSMEKDRVFSKGVKYDFINFANWIIQANEKKKGDLKLLIEEKELTKYRAMLATIISETPESSER